MLDKIASWYETSKRLKFIGLLLFAAVITFQPVNFSPTFIIIFFWFFYLLSFRPIRLIHLVNNFWFWWFFAFYLWYIFGVSYTTNTHEGWRLVLLKTTMFLWPLAFGSLSILTLKHVKLILYAFVGFLFISSFTCLMLSVLEFYQTGVAKVMFGNNLAHWQFLPNHYFGLYTSFAILVLVKGLFNTKTGDDIFRNLKIVLLIYFSIFLILLSVRIQLVALPVALLVVFISSKMDASVRLLWMKIVGVSLLAFAALVIAIPDSRRRIVETFDELKSYNGMVENRQTNHRVFIWSNAIEVIKENFWTGTGTGGEDEALKLKLDKVDAKFWNGTRVYYLKSGHYNYHNQYLQWLASNGIIGFVFIIGTFFIAAVWAIKKRQSLALGFLALCAISFLTESMLERQAGVLLFSFFFGLFFVNRLKGNKAKTGQIVKN